MKGISNSSAIMFLAVVILIVLGSVIYFLVFYRPLGTINGSGIYRFATPSDTCVVTYNILECNVSGKNTSPAVTKYNLTVYTGSYISTSGVYVYCTSLLNSSEGVINCTLPSAYAWNLDYYTSSGELYLNNGQSSNWP